MTAEELVALADAMARQHGYRWEIRLDGSIRVRHSHTDVRCPLQVAGLSKNQPLPAYPGLLPEDNYLVAAEVLDVCGDEREAVVCAADSKNPSRFPDKPKIGVIRKLMLETFHFIS